MLVAKTKWNMIQKQKKMQGKSTIGMKEHVWLGKGVLYGQNLQELVLIVIALKKK